MRARLTMQGDYPATARLEGPGGGLIAIVRRDPSRGVTAADVRRAFERFRELCEAREAAAMALEVARREQGCATWHLRDLLHQVDSILTRGLQTRKS